MNRIFASLCLCWAISFFAPSPAAAVTISWVPVGNPGNAADTAPSQPFGAVDYTYNIDKYDVTNSQYVELLNAKDPTGVNSLGLYNSDMSNPTSFGGISFSAGNPSGSKYSVIAGLGNRPVNNVTWYDAIRFANWLNNGQGNGDTETGAYTLGPLSAGGVPTNGSSIMRNAGATVFLPSEDEWYKAAYYNAATKSYFQYPTSSNGMPTGEAPPGGSNSANFDFTPGGPNNLTDVGAYTGTTSPYGAFDMGGDVEQWSDSLLEGSSRGFRGGAFNEDVFVLQASFRGIGDPTTEVDFIGFRVASVPEPSTGLLAVLASGLAFWKRKRFRRVA